MPQRALDLAGIADVDGTHLYAEGRRNRLNRTEKTGTGRNSGLTNDCHACHVWRDLLEQLEPFCH